MIIEDYPCSVIFDTGASVSIINQYWLLKNGINRQGMKEGMMLKTVNGQLMKSEGAIVLVLESDIPHTFQVLDNLQMEGIISMDLLKKGVVDGINNTVKIMNKSFQLEGEESKVKIPHKIKVPPNSCQIIKAEVKPEKTGTVIYNPQRSKHCLYAASINMIENSYIFVNVYNPTEDTVVLNKGQCIRYIQPITQISMVIDKPIQNTIASILGN